MLRHQQFQLVLRTLAHVGAGVASGEKLQDVLSQVTLVSRPLSKVKPQIKEVGRFEGLFFLERFEQGKCRRAVEVRQQFQNRLVTPSQGLNRMGMQLELSKSQAKLVFRLEDGKLFERREKLNRLAVVFLLGKLDPTSSELRIGVVGINTFEKVQVGALDTTVGRDRRLETIPDGVQGVASPCPFIHRQDLGDSPRFTGILTG